MDCILSSTYFGPIQWYQKLNRYKVCLIEQHDSFIKQTFRNRCIIATTHGTQALSIPIEHSNGSQQMRDIRISDHGNWRHLHWYALQSAYGDSPFFDYYVDDIRPFFERKWDFLFDFNLAITLTMCQLLDIRPEIRVTETYEHLCANDFREVIRPKHPLPDDGFESRPYYQVYQQKQGFIPNLSILDLLFNMGNESKDLRNRIKADTRKWVSCCSSWKIFCCALSYSRVERVRRIF